MGTCFLVFGLVQAGVFTGLVLSEALLYWLGADTIYGQRTPRAGR